MRSGEVGSKRLSISFTSLFAATCFTPDSWKHIPHAQCSSLGALCFVCSILLMLELYMVPARAIYTVCCISNVEVTQDQFTVRNMLDYLVG